MIQWTRVIGAARVDLELSTDERNHHHGHRNPVTLDEVKNHQNRIEIGKKIKGMSFSHFWSKILNSFRSRPEPEYLSELLVTYFLVYTRVYPVLARDQENLADNSSEIAFSTQFSQNYQFSKSIYSPKVKNSSCFALFFKFSNFP